MAGFLVEEKCVLSFQFRKLFPAMIVAAVLCLVLRRGSDTKKTVAAAREGFSEARAAAFLAPEVIGESDRDSELEPIGLEEVAVAEAADLRKKSAPLSKARWYISSESSWAVFAGEDGTEKRFRKGLILLRWKGEKEVSALRVKEGEELSFLSAMAARADVDFAELDLRAERRSLEMNDPGAVNQWHHGVIGTTNAWKVSAGSRAVKIAIVDDPFQMNHPDLAGNVASGWDVERGVAVTSSAGITHSTLAAGAAAAVAGNSMGVAGVSQCVVLPVSAVDYTTAVFYNAIIWAADHGVRVVNVSWNVAGSATINAAGEYLREKTEGVLFVSGENARKFLGDENFPFIIAVAMTDERDAAVSAYGDWVDLAAPGSNIYATTIANGYDADTGTSYATPIAAGVAACLMSINPGLTGAEIVSLLETSCDDLGDPGRDQLYGNGRINFAKAALAAFATLPLSRVAQPEPGVVTIPEFSGAAISIFRSFEITGPWSALDSALVTTNSGVVRFEDRTAGAERAFYRARILMP